MTGHADRIREAQRHRAEPASRSRMAALDSFGLRYERIDDFNCLIEGRYTLNLAMSFWRSIDGTSQGYLISALDAEVKRNSQKPAASRDSVAIPQLSSGTSEVGIAEFAAGPTSSDVRSASLLPVVAPCG